MPTVPVYNLKKFPQPVPIEGFNPKKHKPRASTVSQAKKKHIAPSPEVAELTEQLKHVTAQLKLLKKQRVELHKRLKNVRVLESRGRLQPVKLYALRLEDNCWYVGMTYNVESRFAKHCSSEGGANWTRLHRPIEIHEVRQTGLYHQDEVAKLEDDMTIEYAMRYGSQYVRGGGYCQSKPVWPAVVVQNELLPA